MQIIGDVEFSVHCSVHRRPHSSFSLSHSLDSRPIQSMHSLTLWLQLFFVLACVCSTTMAGTIPSVVEYFPDLQGNLTNIEWLHAVNSHARLSDGLTDHKIHMLEADVIYGKLTDGSGPMPIMGHPPSHKSDLSLEQFITAVIQAQNNTKKGIKLDFKSNKAYNASWPIIEKLAPNISFPVWLNADILVGPEMPLSFPLDARNFVTKARDHLGEAPLSLGWTTAYHNRTAAYSWDMLNDMLKVVQINAVQQPVTLAVRATFAAQSEETLIDLVRGINEFQTNRFQKKNQTSLTIWMSNETDEVDIVRLRGLLNRLGAHRVALDVPLEIRQQLLDPNFESPKEEEENDRYEKK